MTSWVSVPDCADKFTDAIAWNEHTGSILLRNKEDGVVLRIQGSTENMYRTLCDYLTNNEYTHFKVYLLKFIENSDNLIQVGQHSEAHVDGVENRFDWDCRSCNDIEKFQLKGLYRGLHAACISCGSEASVIPAECKNCSTKRVFIKTQDMEWYRCCKCSKNLDCS